MDINTIAVIGAGTMGTHLALELAVHGKNVILKDIGDTAITAAADTIRKDWRMFRMMRKEWKEIVLEDVMSRLHFTVSDNDIEEAQLVIENISEDWEKKKKLYMALALRMPAGVLYAVNTSCIPITRIAALLPDPSLVTGTHFMNPVPLKELVEVIRGYHTSDETLSCIRSFLKAIGKMTVVVDDAPGFVANRLSHLFMNEAAFLVQEGVASAKDIDIVFKKGYGHAMGPLETADLIGLDTVLSSLKILYDSYQDPKFRSCPLLEKMVSAGLLGRKSGKGFYQY